MQARSSGDKTKIVLAASLRNLMKTKPFDKIKIREIVDGCGLNRQTFYYHFQDIYELVEWMYQHDGELIIKDTYKTGGLYATAHQMLDYIENHKDELINIVSSKAEDYFFRYLRAGIAKCYDMAIDKLTDGRRVTKAYKGFLSAYFTCAAAGVLAEWIKETGADRLTSDELIAMFMTMNGQLKMAIDNYEKTTG